MNTYTHTEKEYNDYLDLAESGYEEYDITHSFDFAKRAVEISKLLSISIESAEFLIEEYGVVISHRDRDIAIMVLDMGLTIAQATKLYENGFHIDDTHLSSSPFMDTTKPVVTHKGAKFPEDTPF